MRPQIAGDTTNAHGDPTLAVVIACARPLADPDRIAAITLATTAPFDPNRLIALARRHRVEGFVEQGLAVARVTLPEDTCARLAEGAGAARLLALRNAGEELRVGRALGAAGVDALFVKGATVAMRAHGTLSIKTAWDVDVLVARDRMDAAGAVLASLGYRLDVPGGADDPVAVQRYLAAHKEAEWHHPDRGTVVELHTELTDNPAALTSVGLASPRQMVTLMPGGALPTLATAALFAYLAHHGSTHLWARLKWLADVAALLRGEDMAALHAEAVTLGAGRTPGVALALAHELLGLDVPATLLSTIRADRVTRRLITHCRTAIEAPDYGEGRHERPLHVLLAYERAQGWLVPGLAHRWHAARRFVTQPYLAAHLRVPRWALPVIILGALPVRLLRRPARLRRQSGGNTASRP